MSRNVLAFPSLTEGRTHIPTPLYYKVGDEYTRVDFHGDEAVPLGLYPGCVAVFLKDFRQEYGLHLFALNGEDRVSRLRWRGSLVRIGPDSESSEWKPARELDVYGSMCEIYPAGLAGPRSVIFREDRAHLLAPRDLVMLEARTDKFAYAT